MALRPLVGSLLRLCRPILCLGVLMFLLGACTRGSEVGLNPGDLAPDPDLADLEGNKRKISDYQGTVTVLNFWTSWCAPCMEEMPDLNILHQKLQEIGGGVVAVAIKDDLGAVKSFVKDNQISFPVLFDKEGVSQLKFGVGGFPESFILNSEGKLTIVADFDDGDPVLKIIGPRKWASQAVMSQLQKVSMENNNAAKSAAKS